MNAHPVRHPSARVGSSANIVESLEKRVLFVRVDGIDVSQFQGAIDWNQVAANGKQFVFMRASRTNLTKDPTFETNQAGATAAGLLVGPYHYTLPNNFADAGPLVDPVQDAQKFFAAAGHIMTTGFLRPVIDAEAGGGALGKAAYSQWINNFSDELERLSGVKPIVYANINYAVNFLDESVAAEHDLWLARYNGGNDPSTVDPQTSQPEVASFHPNPYGSWNNPIGGPRSDDSWDFWQYTSNGDGIATGVSSVDLDLDLFNGDLETLKRNFQIGYQKNFATAGNNPFAVGPGITTVIQAENYDIGGQDVSYADTTSDQNGGGVYRTGRREGVDLAAIDPLVADDFRINQTAPGEYVEYTIEVAEAGDYKLDFFLSQTEPNAAVHAEVDGQAMPGKTVPDTDGFNSFTPVSQVATLSAGRHVLRLSFDATAANQVVADVDRIEITKAVAPPPEPPAPPPPPPGTNLATAAAHVRGGLFASQNFGQATDLVVQRGRGAANTQLTYLRFDLTHVTSVASAKLRLTGRLSDANAASLKTNVYSAAANRRSLFQEDLLTYRNKPGAKKLRGSINVTGTADGAYELDLTSFLQSEIAAGRKLVTLVLRGAARSDTQALFASDESGNAPALVVT